MNTSPNSSYGPAILLTMAKEVINIDGKDVTVREDTAKAFHGVNWALLSIGAFVLITGLLFFIFFFAAAKDGSIENPSNIQSSGSR